MDSTVSSDGVYIGRYVLVKYTTNGSGTYFNKYTTPENTETQSVYSGYQSNANNDIGTYGDTFDGTVWQKIYTTITNTNGTVTSKEKYILIAELNARIPRLTLSIQKPIKYENGVERYITPSIATSASSEDAYVFNLPKAVKLTVGDLSEDFYGKQLIENPAIKDSINIDLSSPEVINYINNLPASEKTKYNNLNSANKKHYLAFSPLYNAMFWQNYDEGRKIDPPNGSNDNSYVDEKRLETKFYAFGQIISDLYDILYGTPEGESGKRPFYTENQVELLSNYKKGLVGILTSIATDAKGDGAKDLYGRTLKTGMHYYFASKWCSAKEDEDCFIEDIPEVIGSIEEEANNYANYYIDFATNELKHPHIH